MPKVEEKRGVFEIEDGTTRMWVGGVFILVGFAGLLAYYLSEFRGLFDWTRYITGEVFLGLVILMLLGMLLAYWGRAVYGNAVRDWEVRKVYDQLAVTRAHQSGMLDALNAPKVVVETPGQGPGR
jgi:uncharacterized membrane protein